jgi:short-subunit dehydrogenase
MMKNKLIDGSVRSPGGYIVCTASVAALYPFPVAPVYAASKHGVIGLISSLAPHLEKESIKISAVCPAFISTYSSPVAFHDC